MSASSDDSFHSADEFNDAQPNGHLPAAASLVASTSRTTLDDQPGQVDDVATAATEPSQARPKHVQVALDAMAAPHDKVQPLGKPLASLTPQDVAMTAESMQEVSLSSCAQPLAKLSPYRRERLGHG